MKLYKYMSWRPPISGREFEKESIQIAKCYTKENLLNSIFFFNSPNQFNDPFDTLPAIDTSYNYKTIKEFGTRMIMEVQNLPERIAKRKSIHKLKTESNFKKKSITEAWVRESIIESRNKMGVCCFTSNKPDTTLMWSHYADKHTGICVEFEIPDKFNYQIPSGQITTVSGPFAMHYEELLPKYQVFSTLSGDKLLEIFTTKSKEWQYENEYRLVSSSYSGPIRYSSWYLKTIYAGCKMDDLNFEELKRTVKKMKFRPLLYRTEIKQSEYGLELIKQEI